MESILLNVHFKREKNLGFRLAGSQAEGEVPIYRKRYACYRLCRLVYQESCGPQNSSLSLIQHLNPNGQMNVILQKQNCLSLILIKNS